MDKIAEAVADILALDDDIEQVFADPPEGISDYPTAVVLDIGGSAARAALRGLWEPLIDIKVWLLVQPRSHLPDAVQATRPWASRLVALFAQNDELSDENGQVLAEITGLKWTTGMLTYSNIECSGIELTLTARMEVQALVACE